MAAALFEAGDTRRPSSAPTTVPRCQCGSGASVHSSYVSLALSSPPNFSRVRPAPVRMAPRSIPPSTYTFGPLRSLFTVLPAGGVLQSLITGPSLPIHAP